MTHWKLFLMEMSFWLPPAQANRFQLQHPMLFNFYYKRLACLPHTCQCMIFMKKAPEAGEIEDTGFIGDAAVWVVVNLYKLLWFGCIRNCDDVNIARALRCGCYWKESVGMYGNDYSNCIIKCISHISEYKKIIKIDSGNSRKAILIYSHFAWSDTAWAWWMKLKGFCWCAYQH